MIGSGRREQCWLFPTQRNANAWPLCLPLLPVSFPIKPILSASNIWTTQDGMLLERLRNKRLVYFKPFAPTHPHPSSGFVQEGASHPTRGPDGQFRPVAQVEPMEDTFIGGWTMPVPRQPSPRPTQPSSNGDGNVQLKPSPRLSQHLLQTGYPFVLPPSTSAVPPALQGPSLDENPLAQLSPVERSQTLHLRKKTMQPNLQFMCGPLLRYDAVDEHGVWHGAALIVSKCSWFSCWCLGGR